MRAHKLLEEIDIERENLWLSSNKSLQKKS